ncbi:MAG: CDP-alcohol phosphatidyltransferase family protein [Caldilineales bacterium]|nr:CDP-alcohol phosphatidyltransferase family protein [Caldilineales bacterium]
MTTTVPVALRHRFLATVGVYGLTAAAMAWLLAGVDAAETAWRWAVLAVPVLGYALWTVGRNLGCHHRPDATAVLPVFGPGTVLTLARGLIGGLLAGFILVGRPPTPLAWLPAILYTLAGLADGLDGYLARRLRQQTRLGEILDMEFDALGVLVVASLAVRWGQWPSVLLVVGLARYLFLAGLAFHRRRGGALCPLPPSAIRRVLAGLQMGVLSVTLWPITPTAIATLVGGLFTVPFLVVFARDGLLAACLLDADAAGYRRAAVAAETVLARVLPLPVRVLAALAAGATGMTLVRAFAAYRAALAAFGLPVADRLAFVFLGLLALTAPLLALGIGGRPVALLMLVPVGFTLAALNGPTVAYGALGGCLYVLLFGTGLASLWPWGEWFFHRRPGEVGPP